MALRNELTDVRVINRPDLSAFNVEAENWYTYAGFLKPGYHQFVVYDPYMDRAYFQDFVAKLNQRDFVYPEYPLHMDFHIALKVPNVWKPWRTDTENDLQKCFELESSQTEFQRERLMEKVIKNDQDAEATFQIMADNMHKIVLYQKHLLLGTCTKYPSISFDQIFNAIEYVHNTPKFHMKNVAIPRAQVELCFQSATGADGISALKGAMKRADLLNFLLRLCQQFRRIEKVKYKEKMNLV